MKAVEPAHILAIASGLATPARRIGAIFLRKVIAGYDHVAIHIGDRHLCRGDQIQVVKIHMIHLSLLVGKLACAVA